MKEAQAVWTDRVLSTNFIVSISEARGWLGLYGDTSADTEIQICLDSSLEKVAAFTGRTLNDGARVTDWYEADPVDRLILSANAINLTTVAVGYLDAMRNSVAVNAANWFLDESGPQVAVVFERFPEGMAETIKHPLNVSYTVLTADTRGENVQGRLKMGVRMALTHYWRQRGQPDDSRALDRSLASLLLSVRI